MQRIIRSTLTVPASAASAAANADVTQADLEAAVPLGGSITPYALICDPEDGDVTIGKIVLANVKNDEGQMAILPSGSAVKLTAVNKVLGPDGGGFEARSFPVAHGFRASFVVSNAVATAKTISLLWKVQNDHVFSRVHERLEGRLPNEARVPLIEAGHPRERVGL